MDISIVIPCYNESDSIRENISKVYYFLKKNKKIKKFEIIVIDDGSTDDSYKIVSSLKKSRPSLRQNKKRQNYGKGYSVKEGIFMAKYPYVFFFDADLATPIEEIDKFLNESRFDIVIGSRRNGNAKRTFSRNFCGRIFSFISNLILPLDVTDPQCGIKMFKTKEAKKIFKLKILDRFAFDSEIIYLGRKLGCSIKEVHVRWKEAESSKVNVFKDGMKMIEDLIRVRFHNYGDI